MKTGNLVYYRGKMDPSIIAAMDQNKLVNALSILSMGMVTGYALQFQ